MVLYLKVFSSAWLYGEDWFQVDLFCELVSHICLLLRKSVGKDQWEDITLPNYHTHPHSC